MIIVDAGRTSDGLKRGGSSAMLDYQRYLTRDPGVCGGQAVVAGTRVTLRTVLATLANGASVQAILPEFPTLTE
jgi:uncharacterized protein (DUF433 family)